MKMNEYQKKIIDILSDKFEDLSFELNDETLVINGKETRLKILKKDQDFIDPYLNSGKDIDLFIREMSDIKIQAVSAMIDFDMI